MQIITAIILIARVFGQTPGCEGTNLDACKQSNTEFFEATCVPLQQNANQTFYQHCACYRFVNLENCYLQCSSTAAQQELNGGVKPQTTATCSAAGLNPRALPQPPIWQTFLPTTAAPTQPTGTVKGPTTTAGSSSDALSVADFARTGVVALFSVFMGQLL